MKQNKLIFTNETLALVLGDEILMKELPNQFKNNKSHMLINKYDNKQKNVTQLCQPYYLPVNIKFRSRDIIMWQKNHTKKQNKELLKQLKGHENLRVYYHTIKKELEKILIGSKGSINSYSKVSLDKIIGLFGKVKDIIIAGDVIRVFSGFIQENIGEVDKTRQNNTVKHSSELATHMELKRYSKYMAFQLTEWRKSKLFQLTSIDETEKNKLIKKTTDFGLTEEKPLYAQELAKADLIWMLSTLIGYQIRVATLDGKLIEIVVHNNIPGKIKLLAKFLSDKLGIELDITTHKSKWTLLEFYTALCIKAQNIFYEVQESEETEYGFLA